MTLAVSLDKRGAEGPQPVQLIKSAQEDTGLGSGRDWTFPLEGLHIG